MPQLEAIDQRQQQFRTRYPEMAKKLCSAEAREGLRDVARQIETASRVTHASQTISNDEYKITINI